MTLETKCHLFSAPLGEQSWCCLPGDKPLFVPMMTSLQRHICITLPQWVTGIKTPKCPSVVMPGKMLSLKKEARKVALNAFTYLTFRMIILRAFLKIILFWFLFRRSPFCGSNSQQVITVWGDWLALNILRESPEPLVNNLCRICANTRTYINHALTTQNLHTNDCKRISHNVSWYHRRRLSWDMTVKAIRVYHKLACDSLFTYIRIRVAPRAPSINTNYFNPSMDK